MVNDIPATEAKMLPLSGNHFTVQAPEHFSFSPTDWPRWKRRFDRFRIASGLDKRNEVEQVNTLVYLMGDQADDIFLSFNLSSADEKKFIPVLNAFENFFVMKHNVIYERAKFNSRSQLDGESIEDFITALYLLSENCNYAALRDEMLRNRLVVGVRDRRLSERLQLESELTLEKAIQTVRQHDAVRRQQVDLSTTTTSTVNSIRSHSHKPKTASPTQSSFRNKGETTKTKDVQCPWCGMQGKHGKQKCPARGKQCRLCKKWNHFSSVCRQKSKNSDKIFRVEEDEDEPLFIGTVVDENSSVDRWTAGVKVNGKLITFILDTGAAVDVLPLQYFKSTFPHVKLSSSDKKLCGPSGGRLNVAGVFNCELNYGQQCCKSNVYIINNLKSPLLSLKSCQNLKIIERINAFNTPCDRTVQKSSIQIEVEYPKLFKKLGCIDTEYEIKLQSNAKPYAIATARRVPIPLKSKLKSKLDEMLQLEVIRRVDEPTEWCAPMVIVTKPDGDIRPCVDLGKLNMAIQRGIHPMPVADHSLAQLEGAKYYTKLRTMDSGRFNYHLNQSFLQHSSLHLVGFVSKGCPLAFAPLRSCFRGKCSVFSRELMELSAKWTTFW
ncbi:uncharacterized protein LOC129939224 [Eupeodes corollae]|uniref:uncharacterized protein LOC129939224 n=1 Tax=Eupeodes corollae TaxID=290404 RepID=UPI002491072B|nr:uncharacterized protein LOC129939224 [Eupeodes corollae]